jgi:hypothetical protein
MDYRLRPRWRITADQMLGGLLAPRRHRTHARRSTRPAMADDTQRSASPAWTPPAPAPRPSRASSAASRRSSPCTGSATPSTAKTISPSAPAPGHGPWHFEEPRRRSPPPGRAVRHHRSHPQHGPALHHSRTHITIITTAVGNRSQGAGQLSGSWTAPGAMPDSTPDINDDRPAVRASRSLASVPAGTRKGVTHHGRERTVRQGPSSAAGCPGR